MRDPKVAAIAQRYADRAATAARMQSTQLDALAAAEAWPQWASVAARFPQLSPRNHLLVLAQNPAATLLLPATGWRDVGRWPKKGSTALRLWESRPVKGERGRVSGHRDILAPVFDVTQTDGEPVVMMPTPAPPAPGRAPRGMVAALAAAAADLGYKVQLRPTPTGAAPALDPQRRVIVTDPAGDDLTHCTELLAALTAAAATDLDADPDQRSAVAAAAATVVWAGYRLPAPVAVRPLPEWRHDHQALIGAVTAATGIAWQVADTLAGHAVGTGAAVAGDTMPPPPKPPALACLERSA